MESTMALCETRNREEARNKLQKGLNTQYHASEKQWFLCDVCGKNFSYKKTFQTHITTHANEKRSYQLDVCRNTFSQKKSVQTHMKTDGKSFKCDVRGREFSKVGNFNVHTRIHTGDKPYKCDVFGKAFAVKDTLQAHRRTPI
jgi:KRAB domain-containing zinc finger protein